MFIKNITRKVNLPNVTRIQCVLTRNVKIPIHDQWSQKWKQIICSQWPDQVIWHQLNQRCCNLVTRNIFMENVQLNLCVLTRTVKIPICGQWSQKWKNQVICSYQSQQYHTITNDCVVTRTVNLQDVTRNLNISSPTRTVNLLCGQRNQ